MWRPARSQVHGGNAKVLRARLWEMADRKRNGGKRAREANDAGTPSGNAGSGTDGTGDGPSDPKRAKAARY